MILNIVLSISLLISVFLAVKFYRSAKFYKSLYESCVAWKPSALGSAIESVLRIAPIVLLGFTSYMAYKKLKKGGEI